MTTEDKKFLKELVERTDSPREMIKWMKPDFDWLLASREQELNQKIFDVFHDDLKYAQILVNKSLTEELLNNNIEKIINDASRNPKVVRVLCQSNLLMNDIIIKYKDFFMKYIIELSSSPTIPYEFWLATKEKGWDCKKMMFNSDLDVRILDYYIPEFTPIHWDLLSESPLLSIDIIKKYGVDNFDFKRISANPKLTYEMVLEWVNKEWDLPNISRNTSLNYRIILFFYKTQNDNRFSWYRKDNKLNWYYISCNGGMNIYDFYKIKDIPELNMVELNCNDAFKLHRILKDFDSIIGQISQSN